MPTCFIIMPISTPAEWVSKYKDDKDHFDHVLDCMFVPAVEKAGMEAIRPIAQGADVIHERIIRNLETSDLVLCDISTLNANVFFELGVRVALNKPVAYVKDGLVEKIPFDASGINHYTYDYTLAPWRLEDEISNLSKHVVECKEGRTRTLYDIYRMHEEGRSYLESAKERAGGDDRFDHVMLKLDEISRNIRGSKSENSDSRTMVLFGRILAAVQALSKHFHIPVPRVNLVGDRWEIYFDEVPEDTRALGTFGHNLRAKFPEEHIVILERASIN